MKSTKSTSAKNKQIPGVKLDTGDFCVLQCGQGSALKTKRKSESMEEKPKIFSAIVNSFILTWCHNFIFSLIEFVLMWLLTFLCDVPILGALVQWLFSPILFARILIAGFAFRVSPLPVVKMAESISKNVASMILSLKIAGILTMVYAICRAILNFSAGDFVMEFLFLCASAFFIFRAAKKMS